MQSLSRWAGAITHPSYPYYHHVQVILFGTFSSICTKCFTSTPSQNGAAVTMTAYAISQMTAPLFSEWLEPHMEISLVPFAGQFAHISICFAMANVLCRIAGRTISIRATAAQIVFFLSGTALLQLGVKKLRQKIKPEMLPDI